MNVDLMRLPEVRWTKNVRITRGNYTMIYSGGEEYKTWINIFSENRVANSFKGYWPVLDRVILVKIKGQRFNFNRVQI